MSSFLLTTCPSLTPFSAKKDLVTQYEFFCASYMPYTGLILHHQSFVNPWAFLYKIDPFAGEILYLKTFVTRIWALSS